MYEFPGGGSPKNKGVMNTQRKRLFWKDVGEIFPSRRDLPISSSSETHASLGVYRYTIPLTSKISTTFTFVRGCACVLSRVLYGKHVLLGQGLSNKTNKPVPACSPRVRLGCRNSASSSLLDAEIGAERSFCAGREASAKDSQKTQKGYDTVARRRRAVA